MSEDSRWQELPERADPSTWVTETDPDPVPGAIEVADAEQVVRDALLRGGG
jgi:hypothetical protein